MLNFCSSTGFRIDGIDPLIFIAPKVLGLIRFGIDPLIP